jgi:hypothetical protein
VALINALNGLRIGLDGQSAGPPKICSGQSSIAVSGTTLTHLMLFPIYRGRIAITPKGLCGRRNTTGRDGLRPPAVGLANIFPSTAPLGWAPVALYVALRHITRRPLGSPGVAFFRRDAVATIGWEDRDSDYSSTSCDLLTRFGSSMLITVNRTPSV